MTPCEPETDRPTPEQEGGDPACWLNQVCPECGQFTERQPPGICPRCGAQIPAD
jgi:rubrerythrin